MWHPPKMTSRHIKLTMTRQINYPTSEGMKGKVSSMMCYRTTSPRVYRFLRIITKNNSSGIIKGSHLCGPLVHNVVGSGVNSMFLLYMLQVNNVLFLEGH